MNSYERFLGLFMARSARSRLRKPRLDGAEPLERRSMLAGDLENGVLTITGTESDDVISVVAAKVDGVAAIRVRGPDLPKRGVVFAGVESIVVRSLGGNDKVTIGSGLRTANGGPVSVTVEAGNGNDVVVGGDGDETILGGVGRDSIRGGRGNDSIDGGSDNDRLNGDDGDDTVIGGSGDDKVLGGKGNDSLYGGRDEDRLIGGVGDDDLDGGRDDDPSDGEDDDVLLGGRGNDDDVDDDDSLDDMSPDPTNEDRGDNSNDDEDENEDDDDDDGDFDEDDEGEDDDDDGDDSDGGADDDDDPVGEPITFSGGDIGTASLNGNSTSRQDKVYYSFTIADGSFLQVTMQNVDSGRYADFEIERQGAGEEVEYELEPSEGGPTSGTFNLPSGKYSIRLRSPDLVAVTFAVDLLLTPPA